MIREGLPVEGGVGRIEPLIKVAALAVAIIVENYLYRRMHQAGWQLRPWNFLLLYSSEKKPNAP